MPRRIRRFSLQSTGGQPVPGGQADGYLDKIVKYVPADVIAAWTAVVAILKGAVGIQTGTVLLVCAVIGIGVTYWWMLKSTEEPNQPPATKQAMIASVAFVVWILALGDLNAPLTEALKSVFAWNEVYPKLLLVLFTLVSGKI